MSSCQGPQHQAPLVSTAGHPQPRKPPPSWAPLEPQVAVPALLACDRGPPGLACVWTAPMEERKGTGGAPSPCPGGSCASLPAACVGFLGIDVCPLPLLCCSQGRQPESGPSSSTQRLSRPAAALVRVAPSRGQKVPGSLQRALVWKKNLKECRFLCGFPPSQGGGPGVWAPAACGTWQVR